MLLNRYIKEKTQKLLNIHIKNRNICPKLLRKIEREFCNNLNENYITENKLFGKTVKPSFKDKFLKEERITLVENSKVVSYESKLVKIAANISEILLETWG